jgi:hypothetical protein
MSLTTDWGLTIDELEEMMAENPSLRSVVSGYTAERRLKTSLLANQLVQELSKQNDHDRTKKGDLAFTYQSTKILLEAKSLQSASVRTLDDGTLIATAQCDASDKRVVTFDDGSSVATTCLKVGEFDVLAVCLFQFTGRWEFAYALNEDLPRVAGKRAPAKNYTQYQRDHLLSTTVKLTYPLAAPFTADPFELFGRLVERAV